MTTHPVTISHIARVAVILAMIPGSLIFFAPTKDTAKEAFVSAVDRMMAVERSNDVASVIRACDSAEMVCTTVDSQFFREHSSDGTYIVYMEYRHRGRIMERSYSSAVVNMYQQGDVRLITSAKQ